MDRSANDTVSLVVRTLMAANGDTQVTVGQVLDLPRSAVAARLRGRTRWTVGEVDALARHWGVDLVAFFDVEQLGLVGQLRSVRRVG